MVNLKRTMLLRSVKGINLLISFGLFVLHWALLCGEGEGMALGQPAVLCICLMYLVLLFLLNRTYNAYTVGISRVSEIALSLSLSNFIAAAIVYALVSLGAMKWLAVWPFISMLAVQILMNVIWSLWANRIYFMLVKPRRAAIVCRSESDVMKIKSIRFFEKRFRLQKVILDPADYRQILNELDDCEAVFVIGIHATLRNAVVKHCVEHNIIGYIAPHIGDVIMAGACHVQMFSKPFMKVQRSVLTPEYRAIKRLTDILVSLTVLTVASPLMLIIAAAIKMDDGGPVFYKQTRLTRNGRQFVMLKFRSMRQDAERDGVARLAAEQDDRITPVGRLIRACRMDELPQMVNILKGDMTLVGPRPERPEIAAQYEKTMPAFSLRLQVKAGLTGMAQVYGQYNSEPYEKLQMDLMYINRMSIVEDLRLMLATLKILLKKESTSGISQGQVTAEPADSKPLSS